jgi:hypothetical protein
MFDIKFPYLKIKVLSILVVMKVYWLDIFVLLF